MVKKKLLHITFDNKDTWGKKAKMYIKTCQKKKKK